MAFFKTKQLYFIPPVFNSRGVVINKSDHPVEWMTESQVREVVRIVNAKYRVFSDNMIMAVAKLESGSWAVKNARFNNKAYRWESGRHQQASFGIFQLLETTAQQVGMKPGKDPRIELWNAYQNCEYAIKYLIYCRNQLAKKFGSGKFTIGDVLAAYNSGPGNVKTSGRGYTAGATQYVERYRTAITLV